MYRENRIRRLDDSEVYNFLKYNRFDETLKLYNFKKIDESYSQFNKEMSIKYESISDEFICNLSLIGNYKNILDARDDDFISRIAGYSDEKQFVPDLICLDIKSFITKKNTCNDSPYITYNRPEESRICINLYTDEIINNSQGSYKRFIDILKDYVFKLFKEIITKFPEADHYYRNNNKIITDYKLGGYYRG